MKESTRAVEIVTDLNRVLAMVAQVKAGDQVAYYAEAVARPDIDVFVVTENGVDAGWCLCNWGAKYDVYARLAAPEIQDLNVLPPFRRAGLATLLIGHCETKARAKHCTHVGISFGLTKEYGAAQRLYFKLGYIPDGLGLMYDRKPVAYADTVKADDDLTLMLLKPL